MDSVRTGVSLRLASLEWGSYVFGGRNSEQETLFGSARDAGEEDLKNREQDR
jgi:hypothetical protein